MADATAEFFDQLAARGHEPRLEKVTGSVRVELEQNRRTEHWLVEIAKGDVAVSRRNAKADCVIRTDLALFDRMASGRANALAAILRGDASVEGDFELLVLFQRLFPGPPSARDRRR